MWRIVRIKMEAGEFIKKIKRSQRNENVVRRVIIFLKEI